MNTCTQEYCQRFGIERVVDCAECHVACPMCIGKGQIIGGRVGAPTLRTCARCDGSGRVVGEGYACDGDSET